MTKGERVRQVRSTLGLTQKSLADRIAVSASYYASIERGDKEVNNRIVLLISREFGISRHWLNTGEGELYDKSEDVNLAKIVSLFKSLNPVYQECALSQMNALYDLQNNE